ncbi:MAG: tRNA (adenosine(37)-N6)-threonylcarbamoyltransferase complex transferase subunit TsaD [Bdellovibrionales bacterium]|nr:tRNA (adenosine(37)-N6)-threonylcarbamoyltransferase complex transferase subunit TsaD [Bdellovibrionales bacterium]
MPIALGIETSCDDTCVSLVNERGQVLFNGAQNQDLLHDRYGGIVPELAGRNHSLYLLPLIEKALKIVSVNQIDVIGVTNRPGLLGSLLVGYVTAQTLGMTWNKPVIGVNHIEGHILSPFLWSKEKITEKQTLSNPSKISAEKPLISQAGKRSVISPEDSGTQILYPLLALIVSGGHSHLFYMKGEEEVFLLGCTLDDSAGEALDKLARLLELPFPGGPQIERQARGVLLPEKRFFSRINTKGLAFSFSGIKSAARRLIESHSPEWLKENQERLCAEYQQVIVSHLMEKLDLAFQLYPCRQVVIGGGVIANGLLRDSLKKWAFEKKVEWAVPQPSYCTDNAAMIAFAGIRQFLRGKIHLSACSPRHLEKDFFSRQILPS